MAEDASTALLFDAPKPPPPVSQPEEDVVTEHLFGETPTTGEVEQRKDRQERANARVLGVLRQQFGTDQLGDKELGDVMARFKLGLADSPSDAQKIFNDMFPNGELLVIPGTEDFDEEILFRKDPRSPFARLDDPTTTGSFGADLAEFIANDIGAITGETAALTAPQLLPQGRAAGIVARFGKWLIDNPLKAVAIGAGAGEIAQESIEQSLGLAAETTPGQVGKQAAAQAAVSFVGGFIMDRGGRLVFNLSTGRGLGRRRAGAERVLRAQRELDLPVVPPDLLLQNQLIRRMAGQARAQTSAGPIRLEELQMGVAEVMQDLAAQNKKLIDVNPDGTTTVRQLPDVSSLEKMAIRERREIEKQIESRLHLWKRTLAQGGANVLGAVEKFRAKLPREVRDALQRGGPAEVGRLARLMSVDEMGRIARWDIRARGRISLAYAKAEAIESPDFAIKPMQDTALEVHGIIGDSLDPDLRPLQELTEEILNMPGKVEPKLMSREIGDEINLWSVDPTTQLRMLRSRAFDIAHSGGAGADDRSVQALAKRIGAATTDVLTNPTNTNTQFRKAWGRANQLARTKFAMEERFAFMTEAAASTNMRALGKKLADVADANNIETYKGLKSIMTPREWNNFRDSITTELLRRPFQLSRKLADADPDVLRAAFKSDELSMLRQVAGKFDELGSAKIQEVIRAQHEIPLIARDLISQNNSAGIAQLVRMVEKNGGPDGPVGRLIRAGFFEHLFGAGELVGDFPMRGVAMDFGGGIIKVNQRRLDEELRRLGEMGALSLFTEQEVRQMSNAVVMSDVVRQMSDAGTSIAGAETASQLRGQLLGGGGGSGGVRTLFENIAVGQLLVSQFGQKAISGSMGKPAITTPLRRLILMGAMAGTMIKDAEVTRDQVFGIVDWGANATGRITNWIRDFGASPEGEGARE